MGIDPQPNRLDCGQGRWPHTPGDSPAGREVGDRHAVEAPYTRGETLLQSRNIRTGGGGPIHMGIDPKPDRREWGQVWCPHTHGDRPSARKVDEKHALVAPYTWG